MTKSQKTHKTRPFTKKFQKPTNIFGKLKDQFKP